MVDTAIKEEKEPMMNKILTNSSAPRSEAWWSKLILVASLLVQMQKSWMALILKLVKENKNINEEKPKLCALRGPGYHQWSIAGSLFKELALWNPRPANVDLMMGLRVNKKEQEVPKVRCLHGGIMLHCNIFLEEKTVGPFLKIAGWCEFTERQGGGAFSLSTDLAQFNRNRSAAVDPPCCSFRMPLRARRPTPTGPRYFLFFCFFLTQGAFLCPIMLLVFKVLRNGLLRCILYTCPNL